MRTTETNWTRTEFKAYLLIYAAQANYFESEEEKEAILGLIPSETYKAIHREVDKDNDYQSIQKILHNIEKFNYSAGELHLLVNDMKSVFNADGQFDILESNMLLALQRLLKTASAK